MLARSYHQGRPLGGFPGCSRRAALFHPCYQLGGFPGCSRPRRGPLFYQATPTSTAAALPSSRIQRATPPGGRVPGCSRPRRGPLFYQATPTSTAAAPGSNEGANMRQQGCSCFHLSRANSWARVPGQQHYKFCNKCRVNIAREATGPTAGTHEAAGPLFSSWMLAPILTNTPRPLGLFLASSRPRQLGGFPGCSQLHYFFCNKYRGNTREASRAAALFHLGHQAGGFQVPWLSSGPRLPCIHATSWAGGSNFNGVGSNFNGVGSFSIFKRC